ncbi:MAG: ethylbenzene dehydrogenase-related protein [Opitutales bacterium]|nr:ethylbenzene dehydrogenase-related protein [Opitutales bacterium]
MKSLNSSLLGGKISRFLVPVLAIFAFVLTSGCGNDEEIEDLRREISQDPESNGESQQTLQVAGYLYDDQIHLHFVFETEQPHWYHQYWVYESGEWIRYGSGSEGPDPDGLYEDRISVMWDDGKVDQFAQTGGYTAVHDGIRSTRSEVSAEEVESHPYLGEELGRSDVRKFIRESRDESSDEPLWAAVRSEEELREMREEGLFLDLWQWRAHRSHPMGYADNGYVLEYRHSSEGQGMYTTNQDPETGKPLLMFDAEKTGQTALTLEGLRNRDYGQEDYYYLSEALAVPFDPGANWQEGDAIPQRLLQEPDGSRGAIRAEGSYHDGAWRIALRRSLESPNPLDSKTFAEGDVFNAAFAVHSGGVGARHHLVSMPITVGFNTDADLSLPLLDSPPETPEGDLTWKTLDLFDPGDPTTARE